MSALILARAVKTETQAQLQNFSLVMASVALLGNSNRVHLTETDTITMMFN
jgi:hypothetical protein